MPDNGIGEPEIHETDMAAAMEIAARFNSRKMPWIAMVIAKHMKPLHQRVAELERERDRLAENVLKHHSPFIGNPKYPKAPVCHCTVCEQAREALRAVEEKDG